MEVTDIENYLGSGYNELLYTDDSGYARLKSSFYDSVKKEHLIFYEPGIDEIGYTYNVSLTDWTTTEFDTETNTTYNHTELAEDSTVDIALDQWGNAVVYINGAGTVVLPKPFATDANGVYYPLTWQLDKSNHVLRIGDLETLNNAVYPVTIDPTELITNGGFETGDFTGWAHVTGSASTPTVVLSSGAITGTYSCNICAASDGSPAYISQAIDLTGVSAVTFKMKRLSTPGTATFRVYAGTDIVYSDTGGGTTVESNSVPVSYSGSYTLKWQTSWTAGNGYWVKLDDISALQAVVTPVAGFTADTTSGNYPLTVHFTDTSTNTPTEWYWDFGDGIASDTQNPTHTYNTVGTYNVSMKATNSAGSDWENKTDYITVTTTIPTTSTCDFTANRTYGTAPLTVLFNDTSDETATSWMWGIDGVYQASTQDMTVTFNTAGIYSISHTAIGPGWTDSETKTNYIQVYSANYGGIYGYIFDADTSQPISSVNCQLSNSSATATTLSDSDGYYYFWPVYNGVYELTVSKSGYTTGTLPNTIINGTTLRQDIYLTQSGDLVQDENITNYSSDWLTFELTTDDDTKTITLDYEVTQGNTNYASCTIYDDSEPVYSSNVSTQSGTFSYTGSAGNNYLVSFDVMNSEGNRYSGAYPVLFYRGFPSSNPIFPPDMPQGLINGILVFAAIVCMMMFGKAYIEIGMILGTAVLAASYIWGFLNLPESIQTPVIIFLSALVAGGEYIAKKKVLG
ncbi:PKD domain-containing protein [Methanosarcina sp. T3]|uniref:PKD domain-containing protein n=1 Tax=Methanosarcina sp. T3 TaxID=3439062 RepID=UPI003F845714